MSTRRANFYELARSDQRYALEAYEFLCHALNYTQKMLGKPRLTPENPQDPESHVTGQDLLEGIRRFALEQFGRMGYVVFKMWGIHSTADFGRMVYTLIDAGLWHKSDSDRIEDFDDLYDLRQTFLNEYRIEWDDGE